MSSLLHLGAHCAYQSCRTIDFLPFECDFCHLRYCLDHRSINQHDCQSINQSVDLIGTGPINPEVNRFVQKCPICQKDVFIAANQSINQIMDQHIGSKCTLHLMSESINQSMKIKKIKNACHFEKCTNPENYQTINCAKCSHQFCLTHRFPHDHLCPSVNQSIKQSNNQSINQSAGEKHSKGKALMEKLRLEREAKEKSKKSINQSTNQSINQSRKPTTLQQIRASMSSINQSINQSITGVTNALGITSPEPTDQSINQSINQSPNFSTPSASELKSIIQSATGDQSINESDRIYLRVLLPSNTAQSTNQSINQSTNQSINQSVNQSLKSRCVWLNKKWTVGRALDSVADLCSVKNLNHLSSETTKLTMTSSISILPLPYDIPMILLHPIVQNGATVALRRIPKEQISPRPKSTSPQPVQ